MKPCSSAERKRARDRPAPGRFKTENSGFPRKRWCAIHARLCYFGVLEPERKKFQGREVRHGISAKTPYQEKRKIVPSPVEAGCGEPLEVIFVLVGVSRSMAVRPCIWRGISWNVAGKG